jgi:Na+-translocating ferredoxin:NAD+ oxidoreductase subunit B
VVSVERTAGRRCAQAIRSRRAKLQVDTQAQRDAKAQDHLGDLAAHSAITDAATLARKKALISQAMQRAQARRKPDA